MCNGFHLWGSCQSRDTCVDHELAELLFTWFLKRDYEKRIFEKKKHQTVSLFQLMTTGFPLIICQCQTNHLRILQNHIETHQQPNNNTSSEKTIMARACRNCIIRINLMWVPINMFKVNYF